MKTLISGFVILAVAAGSAAFADSGHIVQAGGHSHWLDYAAISGLVVAGFFLAISMLSRRTQQRPDAPHG